jgi:hypothetical protein
MLTHTKKKKGIVGWWLVGIIPIINFYWVWRVSKILVEHEEE